MYDNNTKKLHEKLIRKQKDNGVRKNNSNKKMVSDKIAPTKN